MLYNSNNKLKLISMFSQKTISSKKYWNWYVFFTTKLEEKGKTIKILQNVTSILKLISVFSWRTILQKILELMCCSLLILCLKEGLDVCFVHVHNRYNDKLNARALKCIFGGYPGSQKGYKCYLKTAKTGKQSKSMNVTVLCASFI